VVVAADVFLGATVALGRFLVSAEAKYYVTDKTDFGVDLDGLAVTGGVGLRF